MKINFPNIFKNQIRFGINTCICTDADDKDYKSLNIGLIFIEIQFFKPL